MFEEYDQHDVAVYGGYLNDEAKLLQSTSGGIATALSEFFLAQGGHVAGVAYSSDYSRAEYILLHDASGIGRLKGSKYIDCDKKNIYSDVKKLLESGEKVLFFGLPCVVAALYHYIGARPENLLTCELVCHGSVDPRIHNEYLTHLERKYHSRIVDFSARHKEEAWQPSYLYARFENGKVFKKPFYETEYGFAFSVMGKEPCYRCRFKGNNRQGDIMLGDFWGATEQDIFWNKCGVSSVFAETEKGNAFLNATPGITLFPTTFEKAVEQNPMVVRPKTPDSRREKFSELFSKKGLIYAARHCVSLKTRVRRTVVRMIPAGVKHMLRKAISCIR